MYHLISWDFFGRAVVWGVNWRVPVKLEVGVMSVYGLFCWKMLCTNTGRS